ncbi:dihydrolipoyl dehydrogenase [Streptomyces sp. NPDC093252]|uniref:dihydrolipoyl dehydrogenase n=1 Tax=Streptomyces sp. NPDC093252 TaxID=3154980 RepID=UPI003444ADB4
MVVGEIPESVDFLVVGGGPGGYTAALEAAARGRVVTLVDLEGEAGLGGVCLRVGCIPSKALIELARTRHRVGSFARMGLRARMDQVDLVAFQEWKASIVDRLSTGVGSLLREAGVRVVQGRFTFLGAGRGVVDTGGDRPPLFIEYHDLVLATGSTPRELPGLPRDGVRVLDSTDVLALDRLPDTAVIVGGGYIGLELGTALAKLGTEVTLVEAAPTLLPGMPAELTAPVQKSLRALGVTVLVNTEITDFTGNQVRVVSGGDEARTLHTGTVVTAIGRRPNTRQLGLDALGVQPDGRGLLTVGADRLLLPHVAAIGDITPGPALAHKATAEAVVAVEALCGQPTAFDPATIPLIVFSDPEIAVAGEEHLARQGLVSARRPFRASGRALTLDEPIGFARMTVDQATDAVVGVQIVGPHAAEMISEAVLAIEMAATPHDIRASIHPHPTLAETLADVAGDLGRVPGA